MQSLSSATCFQNIMETIKAQNLTGPFAMETPFNSELIKQFYATMYVSGNPDDTSTWILEWMIQGQVFTCTRKSSLKSSISLDTLAINPKHLVFISKTWFYILSQSLMPLSTASDE